ncbi:Protein ABHD13 [Araneus ventricosus]|uniref:Protein ABHD13 n=1 Tax=Araneus ventricosus TaxID=182803 RepID=A0A4Y2IXL8_ARAVE|nr:Protein ABHD13 [Araneus ventricosus]
MSKRLRYENQTLLSGREKPLTSRGRKAKRPQPNWGFLFQVGDYFLYHPDQPPQSRLYVPLPSLFGLPAESIFLKTDDDVKIHAFFIKQDPSIIGHVPTVLYFHGNAGNIGHRLPNAQGLYQFCGCNILLLEYRGYGHSEGVPSEEGLYLDAQAGMKFLLQVPYIDKSKIIVFGRSLGGAVAIDLVTHSEFAKHVLALIVENTFTSIPDVAKAMFNSKFINCLPTWAFKNQFLSLKKIKRVKTPSLFISGKADAIIPPSMMKLLCQESGSPIKRLSSFEYGTHNETWQCKGYYRIVNLFVDDLFSNLIPVIQNIDECSLKVNSAQIYQLLSVVARKTAQSRIEKKNKMF